MGTSEICGTVASTDENGAIERLAQTVGKRTGTERTLEMEQETEPFEIKNNESAQRFETRIDGHDAFVQYRYSVGGDFVLSHTEVPPALGGRGLGGKLAAAALDYARNRQLKVVVTCPFITKYLHKHPEYEGLLRKDYD